MRSSGFGKVVICLCLAAAGLMLWSSGPAIAQESGSGDAQMTVGTYDMRAIFNAYDGRQAFMQQAQQIQQQAQAAQQAGDQQKLQQLQQQMQQAQQQMGQQLQQAIDDIIAEVAQAQDVDVVVSEVLYSADDVETKNVTEAIIEEINAASGQAAGEQGGSSAP